MMEHDDLLTYWANPVPREDGMETLFEVSFDGINYLGSDALAYLYDQSGYGDMLSTTGLYDDYSATDIRRDLIIDAVRGGDVHAVNKYPNTNTSSDKDDTKVLRFTEVKLILAEAYARTQHPVDALIQLNEVATDRDPDFLGYVSTGDALINDILDERRKELAFEGDRYYDFYRLSLDIDNRGSEFPSGARSFPASIFRRILPIPQSELDNNHNPGMTQNEGYPQ
jgi:hypothetical protein